MVTLYLGFSALVAVLLTIDFVMLKSKGSHRVSVKEAAIWSVVWVMVALIFCGWLWWYTGQTQSSEVADVKALEFITGYLIEKSLAVDNVFVWVTLFSFFAVPPEFQKRVLLYGLLGAIVMRAVFIYLGALLLQEFHLIFYLFGAFLVITGAKLLWFAEQEPDLARNPILKWMRLHLRITSEYHGEAFVLRRDGVLWVTPLFVVLVLVEVTDLIFAVDSIPAIFAVTNDPFIVFSSNIFAILGLRAMFFLLADMAERFHLLKYGLAFILMFIGVKMLLLDFYKIPVVFALAVVLVILVVSVAGSLYTSRSSKKSS